MLKRDILLSKYSSYKIGGPAKYFFAPKNTEEIIKALDKFSKLQPCESKYRKIFILGGGTNILFNDKGFDGLVIKIDIKFIKKIKKIKNVAFPTIVRKTTFLEVGAGTALAQLVNYSTAHNLTGLEWAAGIPGTIGGAIRGNAGAFGGEMKDLVKEVISLDTSRMPPSVKKRSRRECSFGYRSSIFKKSAKKEVIIGAIIELKRGNKKSIKGIAERNINYRKKRHPLEYPTIGSIFKNIDAANLGEYKNSRNLPVSEGKIPAAYLIAEAGLKGFSCGGAKISEKHSNFIVNFNNATAKDVKELIKLAKREVYKKFKIRLEKEIVDLS